MGSATAGDEELRRLTAASLDHAPERRRARDAVKHIHSQLDHCLFKVPYTGIGVEETYEVNSRGIEIFAKSWQPETSTVKALVCYCHGYGDTCTFFFEGIANKLASSGFAVFAMDYPGFGLSEGLHGYIPNFDELVDDVIEHFSKVKERAGYHESKKLPSFLFGQSMGGAVALKMHLKQPSEWDGAILLAPMCKLADDMIPPWILKQILIGMSYIIPRGKLVPQQDLADIAFKDLNKRKLIPYNVVAYRSKPRLKTAVELLKTTQEIENQLEKISLPLLILHGEADKITDPSVSKALYEKASSSDKKLRLYKDGCHALLTGEFDEMIFQILDEIIHWLDEHSKNERPF